MDGGLYWLGVCVGVCVVWLDRLGVGMVWLDVCLALLGLGVCVVRLDDYGG